MAESASSTLSPTEEEGDNQGTHELELHYGGELDLHQHVVCDKNPGHADFIPVNSLNAEKLYKTSVVDHLNLTHFCSEAAKLTTKIKAYRVSSNRSKEKMKKLYNIDHYPLSAYAGKKRLGVGSGCVTGFDDQGTFPCPLENYCPHSKEPHQVYGYIIITTAAHVVFDDDEAKETIVEFFDDDPKDKKNVEIAHGVKVRHCSVEGDFCEFMCVTHSQSLVGKISGLWSLSIPFEPAHFAWEKETATVAVHFLRLFEIIKMISTDLKCSSNLQALLTCDHDTISMMLQGHLSECRQSYLKNAISHTSHFATVKHFLNAAESVSGISGVKDSVLRVMYKDDASFPMEFSKEFCTNVDIETTVKRIALTGTVAIIGSMSLFEVTLALLNYEGIYILFSVLLNAFGDTDLPLLTKWSTETLSYHLSQMFSGVKRFDTKDQDNNFSAIKRWFILAHADVLPAINDNLDAILKGQMIAKLSPQVVGNYWQIKDNLLRMSDYLDQVASTLNIYFGDVDNSAPESVFHMPGPNSTPEEICRHLTQYWITNTVIPYGDDFLRATVGVRQKIHDLIKKFAVVMKKITASYNFHPITFWEDLRKSLADTDVIFNDIHDCLYQTNEAFLKEVKRILSEPRNFLTIHISHPHGQSKQVTTGEHFSCNTATGHYEHIYTVPTCMGCSGGPVWILPRGECEKILWDQIYAVPHGGCYDRGNKLNHSSSWTFSPFSVDQGRNELDSTEPKQHSFKSLYVPSQTGSSATEISKEKLWLLYFLRSVDSQLLSGMSVNDAIIFKKSHGTGERISTDDDVESLLNKACRHEWRGIL